MISKKVSFVVIFAMLISSFAFFVNTAEAKSKPIRSIVMDNITKSKVCETNEIVEGILEETALSGKSISKLSEKCLTKKSFKYGGKKYIIKILQTEGKQTQTSKRTTKPHSTYSRTSDKTIKSSKFSVVAQLPQLKGYSSVKRVLSDEKELQNDTNTRNSKAPGVRPQTGGYWSKTTQSVIEKNPKVKIKAIKKQKKGVAVICEVFETKVINYDTETISSQDFCRYFDHWDNTVQTKQKVTFLYQK